MKRLENKDISLVHSMIPLVSNIQKHVSCFPPSSDLILNAAGSSSGLLHHEAEQLLRAHGESNPVMKQQRLVRGVKLPLVHNKDGPLVSLTTKIIS